MREINAGEITNTVKELVIKANKILAAVKMRKLTVLPNQFFPIYRQILMPLRSLISPYVRIPVWRLFLRK